MSPEMLTITTMSNSVASRSTTSVALLGAGIGIAIGLILPTFCRRFGLRSSSRSTDQQQQAQSVHAVRSSLDDNNSSSTSTTIRIERDKLDDLVTDILISVGCSKDSARLVANVLSYADSRGIPSHGANRADTYVNEINAGLVDVKAVPVIEKCSDCCAVVSGNNTLGPVTSKVAMELAIQLASSYGVGFVVCHSSNHYGAAGYWAQMALGAGYMGLSFTNTSPIAVPTRSRARGLGTNPFCFMAPATTNNNNNDTTHDESFQLDMATTTVPIGKIEVMDRLGKPVPFGWGVDRHGADCSDGAEICKFGGLYPLGGAEETAGYKGYGLGMFVEILCSVLSGAATVGPDVLPWTVTRGGPLNYGHCFIVIDPARFASDFEGRLGEYLDRMRNLPGEPLIAGDPEREFERDAAEKGILLHRAVATTLKALAKTYGIEVPQELESLDETKSKASLYE